MKQLTVAELIAALSEMPPDAVVWAGILTEYAITGVRRDVESDPNAVFLTSR